MLSGLCFKIFKLPNIEIKRLPYDGLEYVHFLPWQQARKTCVVSPKPRLHYAFGSSNILPTLWRQPAGGLDHRETKYLS